MFEDLRKLTAAILNQYVSRRICDVNAFTMHDSASDSNSLEDPPDFSKENKTSLTTLRMNIFQHVFRWNSLVLLRIFNEQIISSNYRSYCKKTQL